MKILILAAIFFGLGTTILRAEDKYFAKVSFHVITDQGTPVENAEVGVTTFSYWKPGDNFGREVFEDTKGSTDKDGNVVLSFQCVRGDFFYGAKAGKEFYETSGSKYMFSGVKDGQFNPWNPTIDLVLKPKLNPIPMYARIVGELPSLLELPEVGKPVGFDLMASDWVAPHGKGTVADFVFKIERRFTSVQEPFEATLTLSFSNKGDGIQAVFAPPFIGSALRLPRFAPENGYAPELAKRIARPAAGAPMEQAFREDQNYFFRVRTVLDKKGKIVSALYGKIDRDFRFGIFKSKTASILFTYYLNPNANNRNMEFDPKQNLLTGLPDSQRPSSP